MSTMTSRFGFFVSFKNKEVYHVEGVLFVCSRSHHIPSRTSRCVVRASLLVHDYSRRLCSPYMYCMHTIREYHFIIVQRPDRSTSSECGLISGESSSTFRGMPSEYRSRTRHVSVRCNVPVFIVWRLLTTVSTRTTESVKFVAL